MKHCLKGHDVLLTVIRHNPQRISLTTMDTDPKIPSLVIHLLLLSQESRNRIESIINHEEIPLRFCASIDMMHLRERGESVKSKSRLDELPIELFPIMGNDAVSASQDLTERLTHWLIVIHIRFPTWKIPRMNAVNFRLTEDLPSHTGDGIN